MYTVYWKYILIYLGYTGKGRLAGIFCDNLVYLLKEQIISIAT